MTHDSKWPLSFERIRGRWIGLGFGLLGSAGAAYWHLEGGGISELLTPAGITFTLLSGVAAYWGYRALDYIGQHR